MRAPSQVTVRGEAGLRALVGRSLGPTEWLTVTQANIDAFADATGDRQWIHVDAERAATEGPFGGTVAHGFLTVSLVPRFLNEMLEVQGVRFGVNYGSDRVRFVAPVPAGGRLRGLATIESVETVAPDASQVRIAVTIEMEHTARPACVASVLLRRYWTTASTAWRRA